MSKLLNDFWYLSEDASASTNVSVPTNAFAPVDTSELSRVRPVNTENDVPGIFKDEQREEVLKRVENGTLLLRNDLAIQFNSENHTRITVKEFYGKLFVECLFNKHIQFRNFSDCDESGKSIQMSKPLPMYTDGSIIPNPTVKYLVRCTTFYNKVLHLIKLSLRDTDGVQIFALGIDPIESGSDGKGRCIRKRLWKIVELRHDCAFYWTPVTNTKHEVRAMASRMVSSTEFAHLNVKLFSRETIVQFTKRYLDSISTDIVHFNPAFYGFVQLTGFDELNDDDDVDDVDDADDDVVVDDVVDDDVADVVADDVVDDVVNDNVDDVVVDKIVNIVNNLAPVDVDSSVLADSSVPVDTIDDHEESTIDDAANHMRKRPMECAKSERKFSKKRVKY